MAVNNPRHSRFFWRSAAMFSILDFERQFKEVNTAWENMLGLSTGQLLAKPFLEFVHPEDQASTEYYFEQLESGLASVSFAIRFRHYDGTYRTILWAINGAASTEYAYYAVGMDITAREQPMVADEMINILREGVVLQYANGTIGACNPSAERILGLTAEQMMGWTLIDPDWRAIHEDGSPFPAETHPAICTLRTGQPTSDVVMGVVKPDETVIWIRVHAYPLWRDDVTTPYAVVISFSDVTRYKETELELRSSQSGSLEEAPSGGLVSGDNYELWDWQLETNEINFSPRWKAMLGYAEYELTNQVDTWQQRIHPADYKKVLGEIQNLLDGSNESCEGTHRVQHKDGSYRWLLNRAYVLRDNAGKPQRIIGSHIDITEQRRADEEIQDLDKKFRQIMDTESDAIFFIDAETTDILDVNKAATHTYGYSRSDLLKMQLLDLSAQSEKTAKALKKATKHTTQQYQKKQDGTVFPAELITNTFTWHGKQTMIAVLSDISERQRVENALWESESKYRQLFEAASNPTIVFDANTQQIFDVNRGAVDLYGYSKEEWLRMTTEDFSAEPGKNRSALSAGKKSQMIPLRWHKKKDSTVFPVEISTGNSYLFQGRSLVCATLRDITERKAAEEALRKEKDFINTLVQASPAFFVALNPDGKVRMMNKAMLSTLDYEIEDVVDREFLLDFIPPTQRPLVASEFESLSKSMRPSLFESHVLGKSGREVLVEWHSRAIVKANGDLDYFFGVGIDVTERKEAEGNLRLFKSIVETSEEAIVINNAEGEVMYANPAYQRLFGRSLEDIEKISFRDYYTEEALQVWDEQVMPALQQGNSWEGEFEVLFQDNTRFPIWERVDAVRNPEGELLFRFSLMHDISERKRMWETLRKQWEEHQMIFNTVPAMIWYRDKDNQLLRKNKVVQETFGQDDELTQELTDCEEIIQLGKPQYGVIQHYKNRQGEERWMQLDKIPYRDGQGHITGIIVFAMDITDYKQTQVSLQESEERMYMVVENMPIMLNAFDFAGNLVAWNRCCEELTGYQADEMVGNPHALDILYPDAADRAKVMQKWQTETHDPISRWETRMTCKDGKIKTIAWMSNAKRFPISGWSSWHLGLDITSQKEVEKASRTGQTLLASVLDVAKLGVCLTDDRGRFVQVNNAYADLYGYKAEDLIGQPFTRVLPSSIHNDAVREYYSLLMTNEEPLLRKRRGEQHRNGQVIDVQIMASRVILEDRRRLLVSIISKLSDALVLDE